MKREQISEFQAIAIMIFFLLDGTLILPVGMDAGKDIWIAIIAATLLGLLASRVYIKILTLYPEKDMFDIAFIVFGKPLGVIFTLLYTWFSFHLASLVMKDFQEFITTVTMPEMSKLLVIIFPSVLCIWGLKAGIEVLGRFSEFAFLPILFSIFLAVVTLGPSMDILDILPVFEQGMMPAAKGAFSLFAFPFGETVIFTIIFSCLSGKSSTSKVFPLGIIMGGMVLFCTKTSEVLSLGIERLSEFYFPAYAAVSRIRIGDFFQRVEIITGLIFSVGGLVKICICILAVCKGLEKMLKLTDYRVTVIPVTLLLVNFTFIVHTNIVDMSNWTSKVWPYYAFPFQVIFPCILLIAAFIKNRSRGRAS